MAGKLFHLANSQVTQVVKTFTKIWLGLTVLVVIVVVITAASAAWLKAMHYSNPSREHLMLSIFGPVADICWYVSFFSWLILTPIYLIVLFIHLGAWLFRQFTEEDEDEHKKPAD